MDNFAIKKSPLKTYIENAYWKAFGLKIGVGIQYSEQFIPALISHRLVEKYLKNHKKERHQYFTNKLKYFDILTLAEKEKENGSIP